MADLVDRLLDLVDTWDRPFTDDDENRALIEDTLENDPKAIISDLLDRIEGMI